MTPDTSKPCWLGRGDVAAIVGKNVSTLADLCVVEASLRIAGCTELAARVQESIKRLRESQRVIAHAQGVQRGDERDILEHAYTQAKEKHGQG